jgi:hypothetical protein
MGSPPPQDFDPPSATAGLDFPPSPKASLCGFALGLPRFTFGFKLPSIKFPPPIPLPFIAFKLSCDPKNPIDVTAGLALPFGGGRTPNNDPDPDLDEDSP